jgi:hypothetical protein
MLNPTVNGTAQRLSGVNGGDQLPPPRLAFGSASWLS